MEIIAPSGRAYRWEKETPPTEEDIKSLEAYEASLPPAPEAGSLETVGKVLPTKPTVKQEFLQKSSHLNRAIANAFGSPIDLINAGLLAGEKKFGVRLGADTTGSPLLGSESLARGMRAVGLGVADTVPQTAGEHIASGIGEMLSFAVPSALGTKMVAKGSGLIAKAAKQMDDFLIQQPALAAATDISAGIGVGAARKATEDVDNEFLKMTAELAGGVAGGGIPIFASAGRTAVKNLANSLETTFVPSRKVGQEVVETIHQAAGKVEAAKFEGSTLRARINKAIDQSADPAATRERLSAYLYGDSGAIPRPLLGVKDEIVDFRRSITRYQKELLENHYSGKRQLANELVEQFEQAGTQQGWLKRIYQFWSDPNYTPSKQKRSAAIRELMQEKRVVNGEEAKPMTMAEAEKLLAKWDLERGGQDAVFSAYKSGRDAGILVKRKNLGPALRDYLGEITSPGERMEASLISIAKLASYDTADAAISDILTRAGIVKRAGEGIEGMVPLTLRRGPATVGQEQLYVPPDVQKALGSLYGSKAQLFGENKVAEFLSDFVRTGVSTRKAMLVPLNAITYSTNAITNSVQVLGQGINPLAGGKRAGVVGLSTFETVARNLDKGGRDYVKRMTELGLANPGFTTADILAGLNQARPIGRTVGKLIEPAGRAYSVTDTALRISVYESTKEQMLREFPALGRSAAGVDMIEKAAAQQTNATYQQHSHINQGLRELSQWGLLNQFAAFQLEMIRNQYNQVRLIKAKLDGTYAKEMAKRFGIDPAEIDQGAIARDAYRRATALASVYAAGVGGVAAYNYGEGGLKDQREEQAFRETILPDYLKNKTMVIKKGKDGKVSYKNAEYVVPHLIMTSPLVSASAGEDFPDAIRRFGETLAGDLGGELALFFRDVAQAYMDPELTQKTTMAGRAADRLSFLAEKTLKPQSIREIEKTFGPNPKQTVETLGKRLSGLRVNETTVEEGATANLRGTVGDLRELKTRASRAIEQNRANEVPDLQKTYDDNFAVLNRHAENLRVIGLDENQIIRVMRGAGVSGRDALAALDGKTGDIRPNARRTSADVWDEMGADNLLGMDKAVSRDGLNEVRRLIRSEDNREIRRGLENRLNRELTNRRLNIQERDKVLLGLGVENGERAEYVYRQMRQSQDPEGYLRAMRRKGVVTSTVAKQVDSLRRAEQGR